MAYYTLNYQAELHWEGGKCIEKGHKQVSVKEKQRFQTIPVALQHYDNEALSSRLCVLKYQN